MGSEETLLCRVRQFCERSEWNCFYEVKIPRGVTIKKCRKKNFVLSHGNTQSL